MKLKSKIKPRRAGEKSKIGFTLVELMVSIAILTAVILIVSMLLTNAQRAVGMSQDTIGADADARTIADRLRSDLAGLTAEGFLAIYTDTGGGSHLVFTAVGPYRSMVDSTIANAARIDYGLTGEPNNVLWRRAFLLNATVNTADDHEKISLADYKVWDRFGIDYALYNTDVGPPCQYEYPTGSGIMFNCFTNAPLMTLPPNSLNDVNALWPYLARPCPNLKIDWTDGTTNATGLIWYGDNGGGTGNFKDGSWTGKTPAAGAIEYNAGTALAPRYCALWTYRKKDNWPAALRITFTLGEGETAQTYEIIVDLPR